MTTEYGRKHTDGSRSGGQPVTNDAASETGKQMNDIKQKALALVNEVGSERTGIQAPNIDRKHIFEEALYRAIEQHEATKQEFSDFKQRVSDALLEYYGSYHNASGETLERFIIPAPKPDPLIEVLDYLEWPNKDALAKDIRAALDARGLEIRSKNDDQC